MIETFQTVLTFLPPIPYLIRKFSTVWETRHRSIHLCKISNMKYTHITVNVGVAEKQYKAICVNPDEFKDFILYLGDVHHFMHFLSKCGQFLSNSRFEEILYQARMFSVGAIRPVLSRKSLQDVLRNSRSQSALGYQPSSPLKNTPFVFFAKTPLNLQTVQAPSFYAISPYILVFRDPTSPHQTFLLTPMILKSLILRPHPIV